MWLLAAGRESSGPLADELGQGVAMEAVRAILLIR